MKQSVKHIEKNKQMLKHRFYVYGTYDEFYIPGIAAYQNRSVGYEYLIYGYDGQTGAFKTVGYFADGRYKRFNVTYEDYDRGVAAGERTQLRLLNYFHINTEYEGQIDMI